MVPKKRSCHKEYTCNMKALSLGLKVMAKVKFFSYVSQTSKSRLKNLAQKDVLPQGIHMCNIKALLYPPPTKILIHNLDL